MKTNMEEIIKGIERDFADILMGKTIIYDHNGTRISIKDLPNDCEVVEEKKISFEDIMKEFLRWNDKEMKS